jgi:hypothetical protein
MLSKLLNLIFPKRRTDSPGRYDRTERTRRYDVDSSPRRKEKDRPWTPSEILCQIPPPHCAEPKYPAHCLRHTCLYCSHCDIIGHGEARCTHHYSIVKLDDTCSDWERCLCTGCDGPRYGNLMQTRPELSSVCRDCRHCLDEGTRFMCDLMVIDVDPDNNVCSYFKSHLIHCKGPSG